MHLAFMLSHTVHQSLIRNGLGGKVSVKKQLLKKKKKNNSKQNREVCQIAQKGLKISGIRPGRTLTPDKCLQLSVNHSGGLVTAIF